MDGYYVMAKNIIVDHCDIVLITLFNAELTNRDPPFWGNDIDVGQGEPEDSDNPGFIP